MTDSFQTTARGTAHSVDMAHQLTMLTLGVRDMQRSKAFYDALGWSGVGGDGDDPVFYHDRGMFVVLWDRDKLAADSCVTDSGGWGGMTLARNVGSAAEVDAAAEQARAAGGTIAREPAKTFWGGYDTIVLDPDGHPWEIAHNPHWTVTPDSGVDPG